ncbi:MAG TPA: hypothetical protein VM537_28145 [Anaerolineae bacterium]|nr:hypothetical protein [Anaerolineae bacterium]
MTEPRKRGAGKKKQGTSRASPPTHPWERKGDESPEAYDGFLAYRDLGSRRTVREAAEQVGKSAGLLARWCQRHSWRARAYAWDLDQDREAEATLRQARQESLQRQAQDADRLQRLAMARLGKLVQRNPQTGELELDSEVSVQDAVRIYKLGLDIERSLPGAPESAQGEEVEEHELKQMTDEELRQLIALARQRANAQPEEGEDDDES